MCSKADNFNLGFPLICLIVFSWIIFLLLFRETNHRIADKKI